MPSRKSWPVSFSPVEELWREIRADKAVTIALHEDDKASGESQLSFKTITNPANGNGEAEKEVTLHCHCDLINDS